MTKVIGLISGTSVDGIDAALVNVTGTQTNLTVQLLASSTYPYPENLRSQILDVCSGAPLSMAELAELNDTIAQEFATAALTINKKYLTPTFEKCFFARNNQIRSNRPTPPFESRK